MATLTPEQEQFLKKYNLPISTVFDASGLQKKEYSAIMDELDKYIAIGVTPCTKANHTMRNKTGHCLQCNPAGIVHRMRYYQNAYIYIAGSHLIEKMKVGYTNDPDQRKYLLNSHKYGGADDWKMLYSAKCSNAGRIENEIQRSIKCYYHPSDYTKEGRVVGAYELFKCSYITIKGAIDELKRKLPQEGFFEEKEHPTAAKYNFFTSPDISKKRLGNKQEGSQDDTVRSKKQRAERRSEFTSPVELQFTELSWTDKIKFILRETGRPMVVGDIVNMALSKDPTRSKAVLRRGISSLLSRRIGRHFYKEDKSYGLAEWT
ncbi:GIY-YIG nuclease family protein [Pedobacter sp. SYSU D00535]|uniref:GIY-YIG nuclease family protein n=1 Tax=Pedobacter sp. SYSU D00535 TaxID=2810308 RepID=UPI001A96EBE0|nr:GIY-YIG nuclease family protein [Pedobacter sp. SYSU D00535]